MLMRRFPDNFLGDVVVIAPRRISLCRKRRMEIIPVIDLKGGFVVRAQKGNRDAYRPIETPMSPSSDAVDVVRGLLALHEFRTLCIADLDAIMARGGNS